MRRGEISVSTHALSGLRVEVLRYERVARGVVSVSLAVESATEPRVRRGDAVEVTDAREDGEHVLRGAVESSEWRRHRQDDAGELVLRVRVHKRFRRVRRVAQKVATPRGPDRRRRVTVPDKIATGRVSPTDIVTYLLASGWRPAYEPSFYERVVRGELQVAQAPFDDAPANELEDVICEIAACEGRPPGDVLRSIDAFASAEEEAKRDRKGNRR